MRKTLAVFLVLLVAVLTAVPVLAGEAKSDDIVILYTNDVHTYIDGTLSYDVLAALKADLETKYEYVLLADAGDHIQGTAYGSMDKGETIVDLMNAAGYDVATLGNHEFDYGMAGCQNVIDLAEYAYLSCNFFHEKDGVKGETVLDSYKLFSCGEIEVAFVGITTPETFTSSTPAYFQDETGKFLYGIGAGSDGAELYADVQAAVDAARAEGADVVIGLGHLGVDPSSSPWTSHETIAHVSGLDAFIDGHSHTVIEEAPISGADGEPVVLTQTGQYFERIGMMVIDPDTGDISADFIETTDLTPDAAVKALKDGWIAEIGELLNRKVGETEVVFDNYDAAGNRLVRSQETNTGDFCADALYYLFDNMGLDVDVAVMNGGGIRNTAVTGELTYQTCKQIHTFGNVACLQTVTGQQLLDALEWGARMVGQAQSGGFLHVAGLRYRVDPAIPSTVQLDDKQIWTGSPTGEYRVRDVAIYNKQTDSWDALDPHASYNLAGYNYTLRDLGDGYAMFDGAVNVLDYVMEDYMVLANYIAGFANGVVDAESTPLTQKYPGLFTDYSTVDGSGRICICADADQDHKCDSCTAVLSACADADGDHRCDLCGKLLWTPVVSRPVQKTCYAETFADLSAEAWYHDAADFVLERGLMNGVSADRFDPEGATTRAMIVTILWRLEGAPAVESALTFADVAADSWYTGAVRWAASEGIVEGYDSAAFGPMDAVTREQLAGILWRYAKYDGRDVSVGENTNILSYNDAFSVSHWAYPGLQWACGAGVMQGTDAGYLNPQSGATRAETAQMLMNFLQ